MHVGLFSFDRAMREEINRIIKDRISNLLFATESVGIVNFTRKGGLVSKFICPEPLWRTPV